MPAVVTVVAAWTRLPTQNYTKLKKKKKKRVGIRNNSKTWGLSPAAPITPEIGQTNHHRLQI